MSVETWYVMQDGSVGDPREVRAGADGRLAHKDGRKVAYAPHGPRTRSVDVTPKPFGGKGDHDGNGVTGGAKAAVVTATSDMKPEEAPAPRAKRPYKTRGV